LIDRPIFLAQMDEVRPVLVLTRPAVLPFLSDVTVAPITSRVRGTYTEVPVGEANGLDQASVVNCDHLQTIPQVNLLRQVGSLLADQEAMLGTAILFAFDLDPAD